MEYSIAARDAIVQEQQKEINRLKLSEDRKEVSFLHIKINNNKLNEYVFKMWNGIDLVSEITGFLPNKFARNVARHIYPGNQINSLVVTDDSKLNKQSIQAGRTSMPKNVVDVIKRSIRKRFEFDSKKFGKIWPKCKNSINGLGRYNNHKQKENDHLNQLTAQMHEFLNRSQSEPLRDATAKINNNNNDNE